MDFYQFASNSPWLTYFLTLLLLGFLFKVWNRAMRHLNIRKHGYPPAHCDAGGDFRPTKDS